MVLLTCPLPAQTPASAPVRNLPLVSSQIHPDGRVTFRIAASKASEVTLSGDWVDVPTTTTLVKDEQGVWATTIGPLRPDDYLYWFTVDGVPTPDPGNPTVHQRTHAVQNVLHVPGPAITFAENQAVPHGEIRQIRYISSVGKSARRMHIYTPPGYEGGNSRYPVLYLLHGGGDDDAAWASIGRGGFILDNLLAAKKAKPMLAIMPDLNKPRSEGARPVGGIVAPAKEFAQELLQDILPLVERTYRVMSGAQNRAVAGVSVGGYATLHLLAHNAAEFGYFGIWSAPVEQKTIEAARTLYAPLFDKPDLVVKQRKRIWLRVGEKDSGANSVRALADLLQQHAIPHDLRVSEGGASLESMAGVSTRLCSGHFRASESLAPRGPVLLSGRLRALLRARGGVPRAFSSWELQWARRA